MSNTPYIDAFVQHGGKKPAARAMGVPYTTFHGRLTKERAARAAPNKPASLHASAASVAHEALRATAARAARAAAAGHITAPPVFAPVPSMLEPIGELLDRRERAFERRHAAHKAVEWQPVFIRDPLPIGIVWIGDPHLDDDSCNLPLLRKHVALCATTPGVYAADIGDDTNNWVGGLMRLFANQDASQETARQLAKWLLAESGLTWILKIIGNHDAWNDGERIIRDMNAVNVHYWRSTMKLVFPNGCELKVDARHNYKGSSIHNPLHGLMRAARTAGGADILVCGHEHHPAHAWMPTEDGRMPTMVRARGYKWHDTHALSGGFPQHPCGASVMTVIDPSAPLDGRVTSFTHLEHGAAFLRALRGGK